MAAKSNGGPAFSLDSGEELIDALEAQAEPEVLEDERRNDPAPDFASLTLHDLMVGMRRKQIEDLYERLLDGTATHQEHAIIQRILAESGYTVERNPNENPSDDPKAPAKAELPSFAQSYDE